MGNNVCPYAIIIVEKNTYFIAHQYKFMENDKIKEGTLLTSPDPIIYHIGKNRLDTFEKLERSLIHTFWPGVGENIENEDDFPDAEDEVEELGDLIETQYLNGNNEVVKTFNQKCVKCYDRDSVYAFKQCGHQCICDQCYQNNCDVDILKCVVCRR